jgi:hypothetical protein
MERGIAQGRKKQGQRSTTDGKRKVSEKRMSGFPSGKRCHRYKQKADNRLGENILVHLGC